MMIEAIRNRVKEECARDQNVLGPSFFEEHLEVVAQYGAELATRLGADAEIVALAAYLHDISAVRDFSTLPTHSQDSAEIARQVLDELGYPAERIERVVQCIRTHSSPLQMPDATPEEVCVSNADAIAQIVRPAFWCFVAYGVFRMNFEDGRRWQRERKERNWEAMILPAQKLAYEGYELCLGFLRDLEPPLSALHPERTH